MTSQIYQGIRGKHYSAGPKIGQGGEGAVFAIQGEDTLVIKIYTEKLDPDKSEKLIYMASMVSDELTKFAAWPLDIVKDRLGQTCGFVMRKLEGYVPLHNLFNPMDRKKLFPDKGYNFLVHVSRNLATAFHRIHHLGIVVGDVNEANILVSAAGMVALIDCDSFQIKNGTKYHYCEVGIPRYTPPELLLKGSFHQVIRTVNTDNFSLATLIFQLLFLGRAPFTGINPGSQEIDEETAIKTHEFAYSLRRQNKKLFPAKHSLELHAMPTGISALFHAAFEHTLDRPTAAAWLNELAGLNKVIVQCANTKIHYYPKGVGYCPWCRFRDKHNIIYFLDDSYLKALPQMNDIDQFVNGFKLDKIELKTLTESYTKPALKAEPIEAKFHTWRVMNVSVISLIVLATMVLCFLFNWLCLFGGYVAILIVNRFSPVKRKLESEFKNRQDKLTNLKQSLSSLVKQHNYPSELTTYNQAARQLQLSIDAFKGLPGEFNKRKKKIEEDHYNAKLHLFLQHFDVTRHPIPSFGTAKKTLIYGNGIRTAADITKLRYTKIAGIGPKNIQILMDWRRHISTGFAYTPDKTIIDQQINSAAQEFTAKKQKLAIDIKNQYKAVAALQSNILSSSNRLETQYNNLIPILYQAQLNFDAFKKFKGKL
ncbi:protein kinase domain-containing protein [Pedobacter faecalis]|uniref:protein kinase domain-containing protein n=1 Tax=Pedobacter faecalis TaxID=3041495 RepID=UPI00254D5BD6|nr:hypothetical protein [Pedobacter sp. ELA7]